MLYRQWLRAACALALVTALSVVVAACGSSNDASSTSAGSSTSAAAGSPMVADAKSLVKRVTSGPVYATVDAPTSVSQLADYGSWRGPTSAPKPKPGVKLEVITCAKAAVACTQAAQAAVAAAKSIGWKAELIDGRGTPQGWAQAFNTALSRRPDAILTTAIPTAAVGDALAAARKQGVLTTVVGDSAPATGKGYDSYVPYPDEAISAIGAWTEIARTDGKANAVVIRDSGFPLFVAGVNAYKNVFSKCSGCSVHVLDWQITDAVDPTKSAQLVQGALSRTSGANGLFVPYGLAMPNVTQAVAQAGKSQQVAVGSQLADALAIQSVAAGTSKYTIGVPTAWAGWAAVDQLVRGFGKAPYLKPTQIGFGIWEITPSTASKDGSWAKVPNQVDFEAAYRKAWGV